MSIPDDGDGRATTGCCSAASSPARAPNEAKRELARRLVDRFHGEGAGRAAEQHFDRVFVEHAAPEQLPEVELGPYLGDGGSQVHLPRLLAGAFEISSSEGRRLLGQGGVKLDGEALPGGALDLDAGELEGRVLQVGKRRFAAWSGPPPERRVALSTGHSANRRRSAILPRPSWGCPVAPHA